MTPDAELRELLDLCPAPRPAELPEARRAALGRRVRGRIEARERRAAVLARGGPPTLVAACLLAVLALGAVAVVVRPPAGTPASRPVAASVPAVRVLRTVAAASLAAPAPTVGSGQFAYVRSAVRSNRAALGQPAALGPLHEREIWLGQDSASDGGRHDVIREDGQDWPISWTGPHPAGVYRPTYGWMADLPTDPDRLLDTLERDLWVATDEEPAQKLFRAIGELLREQVVPPRTAQALYLATTRLPGVELEPDVTDALGRHGLGISRTDRVYHTRSTWILDPRTSVVLGARDYFVDAAGGLRLYGVTAVLDRAVVDRAGQRPSPAGPGAPA